MEIGSVISLGLEDLPSDTVPQNLFDDFLKLHRGIKNLLSGVSRYAGIDAQPSEVWDTLSYADTLLMANHTRMYPVADVTIVAGQAINLYNSAGNLRARLAVATSAATMAHGIAMSSAVAGQQFEMYWLRGLVNTIGGMTAGTLYWLSTVAGAIQNVQPTAAGNIGQPIGVAVGSTLIIADIPLRFTQY